MSNVKTIIKNVSFLFTSDIICRVLSFFLIIVIARILGEEGLGKYSFVLAFAYIFAIFTDYGIQKYIVKEIARNKSKTSYYFNKVFLFEALSSFTILLITILTGFFVDKSSYMHLLIVFAALAIFFENLNSISNAVLQSHERIGYISLLNLFERTITVGFSLFFLIKGYGLIFIIIVLSLSRLITSTFTLLIISKKLVDFKAELDLRFIRKIIKESFPFWLTTLFVLIYFRTDTIMLGILSNYKSVGIYNASYKIIEAFTFIPLTVIYVIFPVMSNLYINNKGLLIKLYKKALSYLLILAIPLAIGGILLSEKIILFLYAGKFSQSAPVLKILILAEAFIFINYLMGYLLNSIDKQKLFTLSTGICVVANVILNFILIKNLNFVGAAIATLITESINFFLLYHFTSKYFYNIKIINLIKKPLISGFIMGIILLLFIDKIHLLILVPIAMALYFLILILLKEIGKEEIEIFKRFINRG